ncbi:MAG TPA: vanadium-dependent haloperoxidase [Gemmatimonadales bacterium]|nr:vanadium-dependent haloperoxidase [Gemmatimonadales bacterium]
MPVFESPSWSTSRLAAFLVAAGLALGARPELRAQQAAGTAADTLPADSAFAHAGPVLRWNVASRVLIERAIAARGTQPARPTFYDGNNNTRIYALVAGAQYDALRAGRDPREAQLAAIVAAAAVLRTVFPRDSAWIARRRAAETESLRKDGLSPAGVRSGQLAGQRAATRWVKDAAAELRVPPWRGTIPTGPFRWRGEGRSPALAISLGLKPWFLARRDQFRPPPPPEHDSPGFRAGLAVVRTATGTRTREQTRLTWRWARNAATLWSEIAGEIIVRRKLPEAEAARALMYLNMALSDGTIACWDAKLTYWYPRPSQMDPRLDLSVPLPDFPSYPSAHATLFAAGTSVLGHLLPGEQDRLDSLAAEATDSRVWAGVHFPFDNAAGMQLGRRVADAAKVVIDAEGTSSRAAAR